MQAIARARFVRTSPRKARLVIDAIRGKDVKEARAILQFTPNYAARLIQKVLDSAVANAENNHHMDADSLKVSQAMVDGGPIMKRLQYAPMGRAHRILKRFSHITVAVEEVEKVQPARPEGKGAAESKPARKRRAKAAPKAAAEAGEATETKKAKASKSAAPSKADAKN